MTQWFFNPSIHTIVNAIFSGNALCKTLMVGDKIFFPDPVYVLQA
ncbi:MAG TPA: hypothetical protein VF433_11060 [Cellvibrio sp.]